MIDSCRVPPVAVRRRDVGNRIRAETSHDVQFIECIGVDDNVRVLPLPLEGKEEEILVLPDRSPDGASKLLSAEWSFGLIRLFGEKVVGVQPLVALEEKSRPVEIVFAALHDDIHGSAFRTAVGR